MKSNIFTIVALFSFTLATSQKAEEPTSPEGVTVTVILDNVLNDQGEILAALHTATTFMKGPGIQNFREVAEKGGLSFTFDNVAPGTYAVSVLHDMNANGRMDFETNGMPKEPYGMSNNEMAMGPPTFGSASFEVGNEDVELNIRF